MQISHTSLNLFNLAIPYTLKSLFFDIASRTVTIVVERRDANGPVVTSTFERPFSVFFPSAAAARTALRDALQDGVIRVLVAATGVSAPTVSTPLNST